MTTIHRFVTAFVLLSLLAMPAFAGQVVWNGSVDPNWNTAANWTPATVPTGGDDVVLTGAGNNPTNQDIAGLSIKSLTIDSTATSAFTISGSAITLTGTGAALSVDPAAADHTLAVNITSASPQSWAIGAGRTLTVSGSISRSPGPAEIVHYSFDESNGVSAADSSGNNRSANLLNGASFGAGYINNGIVFDGVNDFVQAPSFQLTSPITIAVWVYSANPFANWNRIFDFGSGTPNDNLLLAFPGNSGQMTLHNYIGGAFQGSIQTAEVFPTNTWVHVAVTIAPGLAEIYWNGVLKASGNVGTPPNVTRTNHYIGKSNWGGDALFSGRMDEFRIYNHVLSAAEINQLIAGDTILTKSGAGRLVLGSATNIPLTISAGVLEGLSATLPTSIVNNAALEINQTVNGLYSGSISGTGTVTKNGAAVLSLNGNNSYSGATTINAGTIRLAPIPGLLEGRVNGAFDLTTPNPDTSRQLTTRYANIIDGGSAYNNTGGAWVDNSTYIYSGFINNPTAGNVTYTFAENFDDSVQLLIDGTQVLFNGQWDNPTKGNYTLTPGLHSFVLRLGEGVGGVGPSNQNWLNNGIGFGYDPLGRDQATAANYSVMTDPGDGSLFFSGPLYALPSASTIVVNAGGTLDLNNFSATIGSLSGSGAVLLGAGSLRTGGNNASTTFSGVISGTGSLTKLGTGAFVLSGNNTYTGTTTISSGTLQVGAGGTSGAVVSSTVLNNGTLVFDRSDASSFGGSVSGTGALVKNGAGVLTLSAASTYTGGTAINAGTIRLSISSAAVAGSALWLDGSDSSTLFKDVGGTIPVAADNDTIALWKDKSGNNRDASQNNGAQQPLYNLISKNGRSNVRFDGADDYFDVDLNFLVASPYTFFVVEGKRGIKGNNYFLGSGFGGDNTALHVGYRNDNDYTLAQWNNDMDYVSGSITYSGTQVFRTWSNMLDGTGHYIFLNGTQVASNGNTVQFVSSTAGTVGRGFNGGNYYIGDVAEVIFFNSALTLAARQAVESYLSAKWNGILPYGGVVAIAAGATLDLNGVGQTIASLADIGGAAGTVTNSAVGTPAQLTVNSASGTATFSGVIQDGTSPTRLLKEGAFTQILAGANTNTGGTTINAGTLQVGDGGLNGSIAADIVNNASLVFSHSGPSSYAGVISGTGTVAKSGSGTLSITGTNTYTGSTTVNGGILRLLGANGSLNNSGSVILNSGGTLDIDSTAGVSSRIGDTASITFNGGTFSMTAAALTPRIETVGALIFNSGSSVISITPDATADAQLISSSFTRNGGATFNFVRVTAGPESANLFTSGIADGTFIGYATVNNGSAQYTTANGLVNTVPIFTVAAGDWDLGTNWSGGVAPTVNDDVIVRHAMTLPGSRDVRSLAFDNGTPNISGAFTLKVSSGLISLSGSVAPTISSNLTTDAKWNIVQTSTGTLTISGSIGPAFAVSGAAGYWNFDESSGTSVADVSGNGNNGTLQNDVTRVAGRIGSGALQFGGATSYVDIPGFTWPNGGGPVSVSYWSYVPAADVRNNFTFGVGNDNGNRFSAHAPWSDGNLYWDYPITGTGRSVTNYNSYLNKWTHVTLVSQGNGGSFRAIYLDGVLVQSDVTSDGPDAALFGLQIGHYAADGIGTNHFKGSIDDFRIFNRVLSGAEIALLASDDTVSLTKSGTGTLVLSGANTYGGTTTVSAGVLSINNSLALGNANGGTIVANGAALEVSGNISIGTESLTLSGTGIANGGALRNVSGTNSFGGSMNLSIDTLIAAPGGADTLTINGGVVGTGALTKNGPGTLILGGTSTNSATITLSAGTLQGTTDSLKGNIVDNGALIFDQTISGGYGRDISGSGSFTKNGSGTVSLSGNNTYAGTTSILAGTLKTVPSAPAAGSALWLDATALSTFTKDGLDRISEWRDRSGGAIKVTQGNAGQQPTYIASGINGLPSTRYFAAQGSLLTTTTNFPAPSTVFYVGRMNGGANSRLLSSVFNNWLLGYWGGNMNQAHFDAWVAGPGPLAANTSANVYTGISQGGGQLTAAYGNGVLLGSSSAGFNGPNGLTLGGWNGSEFSNGDISELLVYNSALSDSARQGIEAYLIAKWLTPGSGVIGNSLPDGTAVTISLGATLDVTGVSETIGSLAGAGSVLVGSGTLTTGGNNASTTFAGAISGTQGNLTKAGSGTFILSGVNSHGGTTTVNAGVLRVLTNTGLGTTAGGTVVASGAALEVDGGIALGTEALTLSGSGIGNAGALRSLSGSNSFGAKSITLLADATIGVDAGTLTLGGSIGGAFSITKAGGGDLVLAATSSYTGSTTIAAGTLRLSTPSSPSDAAAYYSFDNVAGATVFNDGSAVNKNATLINGATIVNGGVIGNAMSINQFGTDFLAINLTNIGGQNKGIDLSGGSWTASCWFNGLWPTSQWRTLYRGNVNDHQVIIENGSKRLGVYDGFTGGAFRPSGYDVGVGGVETGWHKLVAVGSGSTTSFYIDNILVGTSDRKSPTDIYAVGNIQFGGQAFAQLLDEVSIYQRAWTTDELGGFVLPGTTQVRIAAGATLDVNGINQTIGSITDSGGAGNILLGAGTLTTGKDNQDTAYTGTISGAGNLTKIGTGNFDIGGNSTYGGTTTINGGKLTASATTALPSTTPVVFANTARAELHLNVASLTVGSLAGGGTLGGNVTLGNGTLTIGNNNTSTTYGGVISGAGNIVKIGTGTQTWTGANVYAGTTDINNGTLKVTGTVAGLFEGRVGGFDLVQPNPATSIQLTTRYANIIDNQGSGYAATGNAWNGGNTTFIYSGLINNPTAGNVTYTFAENFDDNVRLMIDSNQVLFDTQWNNPTFANYTLTPGFHTFELRIYEGGGGVGPSNQGWLNNSIGFGIDFQGRNQAVASNYVVPIEIGDGSLFVSSIAPQSIPSTTAVTVAALGTLDLGNANITIGSLAGAGSTLLGYGHLATGGNNSTTAFSGVLSGTNGSLDKQGTGKMTLSGANTYTGPTTVTAGTLNASSNTALGTAAGGTTVQSGATLEVDGGITIGAEALSLGGTGVANGGALRSINGNNVIGAAPITLTADTTIHVSGAANSLTLYGGIDGAFGIDKIGPGILALGGFSTYAGATTISGGTIQLLAAGTPQDFAAYYSFDNVVGTTVINEGPLPNKDGTLINGAGITTGKVGNAMAITQQTPQYMAIQLGGNNKGLDLSGGNWTISTWFNGIFSPNDWRTLTRGNTGDHQIIVEAGSTRLGGYDNVGGTGFRYSGYDVAAAGVTTGWHQLTAVAAGGQTLVYIDGVQVGTIPLQSSSDIFAFGNLQGSGQTFSSKLDEFYFFTRALTPAEIQRMVIPSILPTTTQVKIASGATLDLNGTDQTVGSVVDSAAGATGNIVLGTAKLTTGKDNLSTTYSGTISGSGGMTKIGTGTFTVSGVSTYGGTTTINGGILSATATTAVPATSAVTLANVAGAELNLNVGATTFTIGSLAGGGPLGGNVTLGAATLSIGGDNSSTNFSGAISGIGGIVKIGTGTQTLTGNNTYAGTTLVNVGTLKAGYSPPAGSVLWLDASDASTMTLNGSQISEWRDKTGLAEKMVQGNPGQQPALTPGGINGLPVVRLFNGSGSTMNTNTNFAAPSTVLYVSRQTGGTNRRVLSGINNNWLLGYWGGSRQVAYFEGWVKTPGQTPNTTPYIYSATIPGTGQNTSFYENGILIASNQGGVQGPNGLTLSGQFGEFSDADIAEILVYPSALNNAARSQAEAYLNAKWFTGLPNVIPDTSNVTVAPGATFDISGTAETIGSLAGDGFVVMTGGTLTTGGTNATTAYAGIISGTGGSLTKQGTGSMTLSNANTYTGVTTVAAGILAATNSASLGTSAGGTVVQNGAELDVSNNITISDALAISGSGVANGGALHSISGNNVINSAIVLAGDAQINVDANSLFVDGGTTGGANFTKDGAGLLILNGGNSYTGATIINDGTLRISNTATAFAGSSLWLDSADATTLFKDTAGTLPAAVGDQVGLWKDKSGNARDAQQATAGNQPQRVSNAQSGLTAMHFSGAQLMNVDLSFLAGSQYTIIAIEGKTSTKGSNYYMGTAPGATNQAMHLGYRGDTDYTFAQYANDLDYVNGSLAYTGTQVFRTWTDMFSATGHTIYLNSTQVASNGDLNPFSQANNGTVGRGFGGGTEYVGDLAEIVVFNSALSTTQRTAIENYLRAKWSGSLLPNTTQVQIAAGATLDLNGYSQTVGSVVDNGGSGGDVLLGTGTLTTGNDNLSPTAFSGDISGAGSVVKIGTGVWDLSGNNVYGGTTTINGGILRASSTTAVPSTTAVTIANVAGAALDLNGVNLTIGSLSGGGPTGGNVTLGGILTSGGTNASTSFGGVLSGAGGIVKTGSGTLTLSGANTYAGTTDVSAGVLKTSGLPVAGMGIWLDAADAASITKDITNHVSQWNDKSGNGRNFSQGTGTAQPVYTAGALNGLGVVRMDGVDDRLTLNSVTNPRTVFFVNVPAPFAFTPGSNFLNGIYGNSNPGDKGIRMDSSTTWADPGDGNDYTNGGGTLFINGVAGRTFTSSVPHVLTAQRGSSFGGAYNNTHLGWYYDAARVYNGDLAEVLIYESVLNTAQQQAVETYLMSKWGLGVATYNVLPDGSAVNVAAGATLDVSNINETIGSLAGAGNVLLGGAALTTGGDNTTTSFSGVISGTNGSLVKQGSGAMTLSSANTYTGTTSLNGGTLLIDGSIGAGALTSAAGTTLGGIGTIGGNVTAGGDVAPGNGGIGTLNILGNVDFSSGASLTVEIDGTLPSADQLNVSGTVNINANVTLNASIGAPTTYLDALTILNNGSASPITGTFNGVPNRSPITVGPRTFVVRYDQGTGSNDIVFTDDDVPTATPQTVSPLEDVLYTITLTGSDPNGQALTFAIASGPANGTLGTITQVTPTSATVTYTGNLNFNGADSFTFTVDDGLVTSPAATVTVNVQPVNDVPSFTKGADPTVLEDAAPVSIANWATAISTGPADESGQTVQFNITANTNPGLFSVAPAVASNGTLTFTVAPNANGSADITLNIQDNGGTANGGVDTSVTQTFTIFVTAVNDAPSFTVGVDQTVLEDAGPQSVANWITVMSPGPPDEAGQLLGFSITANSNPTLFSVLPAVSSSGTLTYTPAANANGSATITIRIQDNGGTANGGVDTSATQTFVINVTPVNDTPVATPQTVAPLEDVATVINLAGVDGDPEVVQTLTFAIVTGPTNGTLSNFNAATGQVTYTSNLNYNGPDSFTFTVTDDASAGATANLTSAAATVTLNVTAVNDAPSFTVGADQTVLEDAGPQTVSNWATGLSTGPADESTQLLSFVITANTNATLFSAGPAVASDGTLTYTPAANANGSATITLRITDNGGVANGGVNQSATQSFVINITPVNDQPIATPQSVLTGEDIPVVITLTGDDADTQVVQTLTFAIVTQPTNGTLSGFDPLTGKVTYTPNSKFNGTDSFTFTVTDDGLAGATANLTSTPGAVSITVSNTNNQPLAGDQNLNDGFQRPLAITLFGDDGDPEIQVLTWTIVQQPAHGLLSNFNPATGKVTYTPSNGFVGVDTFTYTVTDDATAGPVVNLVSAPGTITINVTAPPSFTSQPVVSPDSAIVGQPLTFTADAGNATLVWDFGDGVTATGGSVVHTYTVPGVYNASVTATSPEGVSTTYTVAIFVGLDTDDGSASAGAGVPGVTGILVGGKGQQKLQGGSGKLSVNFLQRGRTSFSGSVGQIKFPTGVTYASMIGTNGILTIGKGTLAQTFLFTLDKRGRGRTTFLSKAQVDLKKKRFIFKAGNRPELTDVMESIGANFVRDVKKGPIKTIYIPATLQLGSQVTLVITFQMTYQQRGNTGKGSLAKP